MSKVVRNTVIISIVLVVLFLSVLIVLPFVFKPKIVKLAKEQLNKQLNAQVDFSEINLSFIRNFPNVSVQLENIIIVGQGAFIKDTLLNCKNVDLVLNITSVFKDSGYEIEKLIFNNPNVFAHVNAKGEANWDITVKTDSTKQVDTTSSNFHLKLKKFEINQAQIKYFDDQGNTKLFVEGFNHKTSGDLTADSCMLVTQSRIDSLTFIMDNVSYLSKAKIRLDANIFADLNKMLFKLSENQSLVNEISFVFSGWFKILDDGFDMDLKLDAPKVDFKSILSMVPVVYSNSFEGLKAGGKVSLNGFIKGKMIDQKYPAFHLEINAKDGWFQYPDLPKSIQYINILAKIFNPGDNIDATVIDISRFSFLIGDNPFESHLRISNPISDPLISLYAQGKINLGILKEVYPLEKGTDLSGIIGMDIGFDGRMSYYENNQYEKFKFFGTSYIKNVKYESSSIKQPILISNAQVNFNNRYVDLSNLTLKIGKNDISASGKLENFMAYAFRNKTLVGNLNLYSNYFNANEFLDYETVPNSHTKTSSSDEMTLIAVPKNIDFTLNADFKKLVYSQMTFANSAGLLKVKSGIVDFKNFNTHAFGGNISLNGEYNTADLSKPSLGLDLKLTDVLFTEVFKQVEVIRQFTPIFENATGKFTTSLSMNTLLQNNMTPNLASIIGSGKFFTSSVGLSNVKVLSALASGLKKPEFLSPEFKDLALLFEIKNGMVNTKPFDIKLGDIKLNLGGSTGLDQSIAYTGKVQLPSKFSVAGISTFNFLIGGSFTKPQFKLDMNSAVNSLVTNTKAKVTAEVNKQVDVTKKNALEEAAKQKEVALMKAQQEADKIKMEAQQLGERLIQEAQKQGDQLVSKASNPITKKLAEASAKKLVDEAKKKATDLNQKAEVESAKLIQKASSINL